MNEEQVRRIFAVLQAEYGNKVLVTEPRLRLWQMVLHDASYNEVSAAVMRLLSESRPFPPSVGDVNQAVLTARGDTQEDWGSLWDKVMAAGQRATYYAAEEAEKLPPVALAAIGGIAGLKELAQATPDNMAVIRAQFRQRLEAKVKVAANAKTSDAVQGILDKIAVKQIGGSRNVSEEKQGTVGQRSTSKGR